MSDTVTAQTRRRTARSAAIRRRVKVGATLDPALVGAVDAYVGAHPGTDRSSVLDEALRLWYARQQDRAMEAQFTAPESARLRAERSAWRTIQRAAAARRFGPRR